MDRAAREVARQTVYGMLTINLDLIVFKGVSIATPVQYDSDADEPTQEYCARTCINVLDEDKHFTWSPKHADEQDKHGTIFIVGTVFVGVAIIGLCFVVASIR